MLPGSNQVLQQAQLLLLQLLLLLLYLLLLYVLLLLLCPPKAMKTYRSH